METSTPSRRRAHNTLSRIPGSAAFIAPVLATVIATASASMVPPANAIDGEGRWSLGSRAGISITIDGSRLSSTNIAISAVNDDFFRRADSSSSERSWLISKVLEQVRIWDQDIADQIRYDGELESGSAGVVNGLDKDAYPKLLVPILQIRDDLDQIRALLVPSLSSSAVAEEGRQQVGVAEWRTARDVLLQPAFETKNLKSAFNRYGDNIYYRDTERANLYLGGGATPGSEQSLAYLLRNDLITSLDNLRSELDYCLEGDGANKNCLNNDDNDVALYMRKSVDALNRYLDLVPLEQRNRSRELMGG